MVVEAPPVEVVVAVAPVVEVVVAVVVAVVMVVASVEADAPSLTDAYLLVFVGSGRRAAHTGPAAFGPWFSPPSPSSLVND